MRLRWVALFAVAVAGCGGSQDPGSDPTGASPAASGLTAAEIAIVRLVQGDSGKLTINAAQMFGDRASLTPALVQQFAPTRLRIATRLQQGAIEAGQELEPLLSQATVAAAAGTAGAAAFEALAECGQQAAAVYRQAARGSVDEKAMEAADQTCQDAQDAANEAERQANALPDAAPAQRTAGGAATVTLTNRPADDPQAAEVVANVTTGQQLTVNYRLTNVGSFPADLTQDCDGPLTFDVSLVVAGSPPAIDVTQAGYSESGQKEEVPAKILGKDRIQVRLGTFTITDGAAPTTVSAFLSSARCPNPVTGTPFTPTFDTGLPETLVITPG